MRRWAAEAIRLMATGEATALVFITATGGSTPRDVGTAMLVTPRATLGTIGGGALEHQAIEQARRLIAADRTAVLQDYPLGPLLGQCCGGHVQVLIERLTRDDLAWLDAAADAEDAGVPRVLETTFEETRLRRAILPPPGAEGCFGPDGARLKRLPLKPAKGTRMVHAIAGIEPDLLLFGAGHVGRALAPILATLAFRTIWIDDRPGAFPPERPAGMISAADPLGAIAHMSPGAYVLIMTHDHALDYALVQATLTRGDAAYCGVIGSETKAARFRKRLIADGLDPAGLTCPVGLKLASKLPAAIAVSAAAEILTVRDRRDALNAAPPLPARTCAC